MGAEEQNFSLVRKLCCYGNRRAEYFTGEKHLAIFHFSASTRAEYFSDKNSAVSVAKLLLCMRNNSATVVAGQ